MSLALRGASFRWPDGKLALSEAEIELRGGRVIALLGPNGAGKSTLLGLASGRLAPSSGSAELEGKPLRAWDAAARARNVALLPQFERLPFNYSVRDFVLLGRAPHVGLLALPSALDEAKAAEAIEELGLEALADRGVTELSGGELQLVRIARCLAQEALYLLLDEPTSMLDPAHARSVAEAMRGLAASGRGLLFSTHDPALALFAADEALLLRNGRTVARGPVSTIVSPAALSEAFGVAFAQRPLPSAY